MKMHRVFAGLVVTGLAVSACGDSGSDTGTEAAADTTAFADFCAVQDRVDAFLGGFDAPTGERYGGTVVVGTSAEIPQGLNGFVSSSYEAQQHQAFVGLMTLIQFDDTLEPTPYLASSWEISPDDTQITFVLRDDVYWHDGELTTAEDVAFTFRVASNPETGFPNTAYWTYYEGVEVIDDRTVVFTVQPHAEPLDPWRAMPIMPEHLLGDVPPSELAQHPYGTQCPVGNGPFRFVQHDQEERWIFDANPAFPEDLGGRPYVDRYIYRIIPETTTRLAELLTGNLDVYIAPTPDQRERIEESELADFVSFPFRNYTFVGWNSRKPQLADARVRQALTLGTNRMDFLRGSRNGLGSLANTSVPTFHFAYDRSYEDRMGYDPERARALLDEAGWIDRDGDGVRENEEGLPLAISIKYNNGNEERRNIAELMQVQLREIGVDVTPLVVEWSTLIGQINDPDLRDFDGVVMGWTSEFRLDDSDLFHSDRRDLPFAWAGTQNPEIDRLLDTLQLVTSREEAIPLWREYQEAIIAEQPYTFIYYPDRLEGISTRLRDVEMDVRGEWLNIHEWWIPADLRH